MPALWLATAQNLTLTAAGRTAHEAKACGTLAPLVDEQAAEGQTARLSVEHAPDGGTWMLLALGVD
jgi:hypothetical protein